MSSDPDKPNFNNKKRTDLKRSDKKNAPGEYARERFSLLVGLLSQEQQFAVLWQYPMLVSNKQLKFINAVTDRIKINILHLRTVRNSFGAGICHSITDLTLLDHAFNQVAYFRYMF